MKCPRCGTDCERLEADVGVGILTGPWRCPGCKWGPAVRVCPDKLEDPPGGWPA